MTTDTRIHTAKSIAANMSVWKWLTILLEITNRLFFIELHSIFIIKITNMQNFKQ